MQVAVAAVKGDLEEVQCQAVKELAWRFVAAVSDRRSGWLSKPAVRDRRYNGIFSQPHWCRGGSRTEAVQISELPDWFERRSRRPCITERCAIWTSLVREPPLPFIISVSAMAPVRAKPKSCFMYGLTGKDRSSKFSVRAVKARNHHGLPQSKLGHAHSINGFFCNYLTCLYETFC